MAEKEIGFERPLRKRAGGTFLGRGKIHGHANAPIPGVGACPYVWLFFESSGGNRVLQMIYYL